MEKEAKERELAELAKQLPLKLRLGFRIEVVSEAIDQKLLIWKEDGHMEWTIGNKTLLAYFCGRMWCGDKTVNNAYSHKRIWKMGRRKFPEKDITWLFGEKNLRLIRFQKANTKIPDFFEVVDNLFVMQ